MAQAVLNSDRVRGQPFLDDRRIDVVVIAPALVAGVVRRVDVNAVDLAGVSRQQRFQRVEIVAVNDEIAVERDRPNSFCPIGNQRTIGHGEVMVIDKFLALEIQFGHVAPPQ